MRGAARAAFPWAFVVALVLVTLNFRTPIIAVTAVIDDLEHALGFDAAQAGLLTSLPVLCFALGAPIAAWTIRLTGAERSIVVTLVGVLVGTVIRSTGSVAAAFAGTIVIGLALAIGNVVVPVLIRRDVPREHAQFVTGLYAAAMGVGSMLTALFTAPLADLIGWQLAITAWSVTLLVGLVVWMLRLRHVAMESAAVRAEEVAEATGAITALEPGEVRPPSAWRTPMTWMLAAGFAAQSFGFYAMVAWMPTMYGEVYELGMTGGGAYASLFQLMGVAGALVVPLLGRLRRVWVQPVVVGLLWLCLPLGLLLAPAAFPVWTALGGIAQGGGLVVILALVVRFSRSDREATQMSAIVQALGYVVAATAPSLLGALHEGTGGWVAPVVALLVATAVYLVVATTATVLVSRAERRRDAQEDGGADGGDAED
ncbi:MFS transporter [Agromyces soli]